MMPKETGFTLIELMVVVGIISILAAIAVPSFSVFVYEGRRDAAMAALSELAVKQETFRLGNGTYTVTIGAGDWEVTLPRMTAPMTSLFRLPMQTAPLLPVTS